MPRLFFFGARRLRGGTGEGASRCAPECVASPTGKPNVRDSRELLTLGWTDGRVGYSTSSERPLKRPQAPRRRVTHGYGMGYLFLWRRQPRTGLLAYCKRLEATCPDAVGFGTMTATEKVKMNAADASLESIDQDLEKLLKRHSPPFKLSCAGVRGKNSVQSTVPKSVAAPGAYGGSPWTCKWRW